MHNKNSQRGGGTHLSPLDGPPLGLVERNSRRGRLGRVYEVEAERGCGLPESHLIAQDTALRGVE